MPLPLRVRRVGLDRGGPGHHRRVRGSRPGHGARQRKGVLVLNAVSGISVFPAVKAGLAPILGAVGFFKLLLVGILAMKKFLILGVLAAGIRRYRESGLGNGQVTGGKPLEAGHGCQAGSAGRAGSATRCSR